MLDQFLGYDPFEASRAVTRRAAAPQPAPELPSGFSMLPGGNLMYAVADDPEKLYAQAMAQYEARTKNPRLQGLDSPERLYQELFAPLDAVYRQQNTGIRQHILETPTGVVAINPETLGVKDVLSYPPKPEPEMSWLEKQQLEDLYAERRQLKSGTVGAALAATGAANPKLDDLNAKIAAIESAYEARKKTPAAAKPVEQKQPKIFFGDASGNPFQTPEATNTVPVVKTKTGKTYKVTVH